MPAGASPFEVNVVDAKNRRWVWGAPARQKAPPQIWREARSLYATQATRESPREICPAIPPAAIANIATALPPLPIKAPHSAQPSRAASEMMAPSIEGPAREDSAPRLPVITSEEVGPARPPGLPPPRATAVPGGAAVPSASLPSANRPAAVNPAPGSAAPGGAASSRLAPNGTASATNTPASSVAAAVLQPCADWFQRSGADLAHRAFVFSGGPATARRRRCPGASHRRERRNSARYRGRARRRETGVGGAQVIPQWRYKPALLNGQPTDSQLVVTVSFRLK